MSRLSKRYLRQKFLEIIYKIDPLILDPYNDMGWTNLGLWPNPNTNYIDAATGLSTHMGKSLKLKPNDHLLDVGCGYGASLALWADSFNVKHIAALEMQSICCTSIKSKYSHINHLFEQSIFAAKPVDNQNTYDVIVSIDAVYHYALTDYLKALEPWLANNGRIGFHSLMKSDFCRELPIEAWQTIDKKLSWAKVNSQNLMYEEQLKQILIEFGFKNIQVVDLTDDVLGGFAHYILEKAQFSRKDKTSLAFFKIYMTAKLCRYLKESGFIRYVEITASK